MREAVAGAEEEPGTGKRVDRHEGALARATLGGGCFWCLEPIFAALRGVSGVEPGYAGGFTEHPTYEQVCTGTTGHAEVVAITFVAELISYRQLLEVFFAVHDPTTPNRQGADVGPQYRSIILYHDDAQRRVAEAVKAEVEESGAWPAPLITELVPLESFYAAEAYHRRYYARNAHAPYCRFVIAPKLAKFRRAFADHLEA